MLEYYYNVNALAAPKNHDNTKYYDCALLLVHYVLKPASFEHSPAIERHCNIVITL